VETRVNGKLPREARKPENKLAIFAKEKHMPTFIVTWTTTLEAEDADAALEAAQADLDEGDISPEVEEVDE
jgi:hypothetical protein